MKLFANIVRVFSCRHCVTNEPRDIAVESGAVSFSLTKEDSTEESYRDNYHDQQICGCSSTAATCSYAKKECKLCVDMVKASQTPAQHTSNILATHEAGVEPVEDRRDCI
eukprot:scpid60631/ scgid21831/ 